MNFKLLPVSPSVCPFCLGHIPDLQALLPLFVTTWRLLAAVLFPFSITERRIALPHSCQGTVDSREASDCHTNLLGKFTTRSPCGYLWDTHEVNRLCLVFSILPLARRVCFFSVSLHRYPPACCESTAALSGNKSWRDRSVISSSFERRALVSTGLH